MKLINRIYNLKGNTLGKAKVFSKKLVVVDLILIGVDIAVNKRGKASHVINGVMTGLCFTGVGSIISGVWFAADLGTQLTTGKSLIDRIDEAVGKPLLDWSKKK